MRALPGVAIDDTVIVSWPLRDRAIADRLATDDRAIELAVARAWAPPKPTTSDTLTVWLATRLYGTGSRVLLLTPTTSPVVRERATTALAALETLIELAAVRGRPVVPLAELETLIELAAVRVRADVTAAALDTLIERAAVRARALATTAELETLIELAAVAVPATLPLASPP